MAAEFASLSIYPSRLLGGSRKTKNKMKYILFYGKTRIGRVIAASLHGQACRASIHIEIGRAQ